MNKEEQVIMGVRDLFNKMVWLNKFKMEESLKEYKSSEVHCIEYIGSNVDTNVTKLSEYFYMTRGAMSKLTKKLIKKGVIESYQNRIIRKKSTLDLLSKEKKCIKPMRNYTKSFKIEIKLYLNR